MKKRMLAALIVAPALFMVGCGPDKKDDSLTTLLMLSLLRSCSQVSSSTTTADIGVIVGSCDATAGLAMCGDYGTGWTGGAGGTAAVDCAAMGGTYHNGQDCAADGVTTFGTVTIPSVPFMGSSAPSSSAIVGARFTNFYTPAQIYAVANSLFASHPDAAYCHISYP